MSRMRSQMSKKNKYYIPKERYLELLHFSRQYDSFHDQKVQLDWISYSYIESAKIEGRKDGYKDRIAELAIEMSALDYKIDIIRKSAYEADPQIFSWILCGVTKGFSYEEMKFQGLPCGKDYYYERYHKYFYILDKKRG